MEARAKRQHRRTAYGWPRPRPKCTWPKPKSMPAGEHLWCPAWLQWCKTRYRWETGREARKAWRRKSRSERVTWQAGKSWWANQPGHQKGRSSNHLPK